MSPDPRLPRLDRSALVISEGDPFARGFHLGETVKDRVARSVDAYFALFEALAGLRRTYVLLAAQGYAEATAAFAPALLEEMRGIAAGAGRDLLEIVAINARTELLHGVGRAGECTSIGIGRAASADGHTRVAQNWDWNATLAGAAVLWAIRRDDGPDVLTFCEAGLVGKIGINAAGLALCVNLLRTDADHGEPAPPMHVILRHVLDRARSVDEAIALLARTKRATSCNHVLADRSGAVADVEATPGGVLRLAEGAGVVTHANHCASPELRGRDRTAREAPETLARGDRIAALAAEAPLAEARVRAILSDHATAPGAICLHVDPALPLIEQEVTLASIVIDVSAGTLDLADGPPCTNRFVRVAVGDLLR